MLWLRRFLHRLELLRLLPWLLVQLLWLGLRLLGELLRLLLWLVDSLL